MVLDAVVFRQRRFVLRMSYTKTTNQHCSYNYGHLANPAERSPAKKCNEISGGGTSFSFIVLYVHRNHKAYWGQGAQDSHRVQDLSESGGGRSGLSVLMSLTVSVDVKQH